uniref:Uncharacterized protein n=1 Tax=Amphimedon queenslandica TaxID=400682 RepID=A0A1X7VH52_AMPQE
GQGATKEARGAESEDSDEYGKHVAQLRVRHAVWNMMCSTGFIWLLNTFCVLWLESYFGDGETSIICPANCDGQSRSLDNHIGFLGDTNLTWEDVTWITQLSAGFSNEFDAVLSSRIALQSGPVQYLWIMAIIIDTS